MKKIEIEIDDYYFAIIDAMVSSGKYNDHNDALQEIIEPLYLGEYDPLLNEFSKYADEYNINIDDYM